MDVVFEREYKEFSKRSRKEIVSGFYDRTDEDVRPKRDRTRAVGIYHHTQ